MLLSSELSGWNLLLEWRSPRNLYAGCLYFADYDIDDNNDIDLNNLNDDAHDNQNDTDYCQHH
jgi:hypothetical protein